MFVLNETNVFRVCCTPVDMRQGILRLSQLVRSNDFNPSDGVVYVFYNRSRNRIKLLHWERCGFVVYHKQSKHPILAAYSHSLDSIIVASDMEISKFFDTIKSLKKTSEIHPSINVRAKIIFYLNEQILDTFYLGMFYIYYRNEIYEVNEEFRNMINAIIKNGGKLPMY